MVVVEDAESVPVGERGDEQVNGREPVMADARELCLGIERPPLGSLVESVVGEGQQLGEELIVLASGPCGVAGFEEEGQARRDAPGLEPVGELVGALS